VKVVRSHADERNVVAPYRSVLHRRREIEMLEFLIVVRIVHQVAENSVARIDD